jgi:hypothetical protein
MDNSDLARAHRHLAAVLGDRGSPCAVPGSNSSRRAAGGSRCQ